ncbi:L-aspartate oxidase [Aquamicrobium sp. LC103]|uniref:L-aspartate oxidase n=1 Tax=Aquamicrobium sp. LC103 TaxID=1120658 RepID=UPI00063E7B92|nr:L-aspartate oxidase [Aquamicrobium sp. LC103]TKT74360.1 L-aspartate oxidase [Aquamicrobium sp. LC103]
MNRHFGALAGQPVIIGGGIAGLMTALHLAPEPVVLFSKASLGFQSSSLLAQGGIAASLGPDDHSSFHAVDTIAAGDGLCDAEVVDRVTEAAADAINALSSFGAQFDRDDDGNLRLGLEAAHSRRRIVHAAGDGTGRELIRTLVEAVRNTPSITSIEGADARRLVMHDGAVSGLLVAAPGDAAVLPTSRVVIATGGIGGLFFDTTNPMGSFGQGLALAARAGAVLADLEFVQFHPTALDTPSRPMPLISEAVRGEGAMLIDETGRRFLADVSGEELAPRDIVARAVAQHLAKGHRVYLDARDWPVHAFADRFPAIDAACKAAGLDPACMPIPILPAAHYHMGGIAVDLAGHSSVAGLWACGEAACTGLHGANRLASNSLLEAAVFARDVARSVAGAPTGPNHLSVLNDLPAPRDPALVRPIASAALGLERSGRDMAQALTALLPMASSDGPEADPAMVALMIAVAASQRTESRGAHFRVDFPARADAAGRSRLTMAHALEAAADLAAEPVPPLERTA